LKEQLESLVTQMYGGGILYREAVREFGKAYLTLALQQHNGNISKTAPTLGVHRNTLSRLIVDYGLDVQALRSRRRPPARVTAAAPAAGKIVYGSRR